VDAVVAERDAAGVVVARRGRATAVQHRERAGRIQIADCG
jgi:hypothetical protein